MQRRAASSFYYTEQTVQIQKLLSQSGVNYFSLPGHFCVPLAIFATLPQEVPIESGVLLTPSTFSLDCVPPLIQNGYRPKRWIGPDKRRPSQPCGIAKPDHPFDHHFISRLYDLRAFIPRSRLSIANGPG